MLFDFLVVGKGGGCGEEYGKTVTQIGGGIGDNGTNPKAIGT